MVSSLFVTEGIQYHGGLRSRELGQAPGQWSLVCKTLVIAYGCSWSNKDRPLVNPASRAPPQRRHTADANDRVQSHYREILGWEFFMEQELRFELDLGQMTNFPVFIPSKSFEL